MTPALRFERGTLVLDELAPAAAQALPGLVWDKRTLQWRAQAKDYRRLILECRARSIAVSDEARAYDKLETPLAEAITPRPHQQAALEAWLASGCLGVVSLPTGAGKTILAVLAIARTARPTLVVVPTIDLMQQWEAVLQRYFARPIGLIGGGSHDVQALTVATYDSALLHIERLGNRFGLIVFDECHHLPAPQYQSIATGAIAPFRLGLSATVERPDGKEEIIYQLVGPMVYEGHIHTMVSDVLAPYDVVTLQVQLTPEERAAYSEARAIYVGFLRQQGINFSDGGWMEFVRRAARSLEGKRAMAAFREQKRLAQAAEGKLTELWRLLGEHADERLIVFTDDNALAYRIGREFVLPVLTHQTKLKERKHMLEAFRSGLSRVIVTSKVLNEGVDVPEASIGIVVSGSGAVREHVQRLGRILRHRPGKRAVLYEIVSGDTSELYVRERRRQHHAYQRPSSFSR